MPATREAVQRLRRVTSAQNALIRDLRRSFRGAEPVDGFVAIEGAKIVEEAARSGLRFRAVIVSDSGIERSQRLLPQLKSSIETVLVSDDIFHSAVNTEQPQGIAAMARFPEFAMKDLLQDGKAVLIACGVQDPGNLGTVLRSAEAFGAGGVVLCEGTVSRFNAKVVRASAGSVFRLPAVNSKFKELRGELTAAGYRLIGTSSHRGSPLPGANLIGNIAFVIGNEGSGLAKDVLALIDELVTIPHTDKVESLNAGVAASLLLYEAGRQRNP